MAIVRVQSAAGDSTGTDVTATLAATATANNLLVAFHSNRGIETPPTPTGWTQTATIDGDNTSTMFHKVSDGTETGITVSLLLAAEQTVSVIEYSGTATADVSDGAVTNSSNAFSTSFATADLTTTNADDVLVAGIGLSGTADGTIAWSNSFGVVTQRASFGGSSSNASEHGTADRIVSATATYNTTASWTGLGRRKVTILAAFKAASAGGAVALDGIATAASDADGDMNVALALDGTATAASQATGSMDLALALDGTATAASSATGELTILAPVKLDGIAEAASGASGSLSVLRLRRFFHPPSHLKRSSIRRDRLLTPSNLRLATLLGPQSIGRSVLKIDGTYQIIDTPRQDQVDSATEYYAGGHVHEVTKETADDLEAAGFTIVEETELV